MEKRSKKTKHNVSNHSTHKSLTPKKAIKSAPKFSNKTKGNEGPRNTSLTATSSPVCTLIPETNQFNIILKHPKTKPKGQKNVNQASNATKTITIAPNKRGPTECIPK